MKRRWNLSVWAGFLIVLSALVTYVTVFIRFPATRDFPWASLLIFGAGLFLIARGVGRAYRQPQLYRGKIAGPILLVLGVGLLGFFCFNIFYFLRQVPPSAGARVKARGLARAPRSQNDATEIRQNRRQISVEARGSRTVDHTMVIRQR